MQPCSKSSQNLYLCAGCDKKARGCTRASAADTLDLYQVVMVSMDVSKLGRMVRNRAAFIFIFIFLMLE